MVGSTIYDDGQTSSHLGSGGWIRTNDLQVMSLTSYRAALPRNKLYVLILTSYSKMSTVLSGAHDWIRTNNLQHLKLTPLPVGLHARMAFRPHNRRITGPWSSCLSVLSVAYLSTQSTSRSLVCAYVYLGSHMCSAASDQPSTAWV